MCLASRYIEELRIFFKEIEKSNCIYSVNCEGDLENFARNANEWIDRKIENNDTIDATINLSLNTIAVRISWGVSLHAIRNTIISDSFIKVGFFCFAAYDRKKIIIYDANNNVKKLNEILDKLNQVFTTYFNNSISLEKENSLVFQELYKRLDEAEDFYSNKHGAWIEEFYNNLGDELSKFSFSDFIKQRILGYIRWQTKNMYPISPPSESLAWRKQRKSNPPTLPILNHCSKLDRDFFHLSAFIYEQYGIEGVVEAKKGEVVIDAGAFIADTALYFAAKVGSTGKVYGFEPLKKSVDAANDNLASNKVFNVEMVNLALSDKNEKLYFNSQEIASNVARSENGDLEVDAVRLDYFVEQGGIKLDFIKADVEGCELALLRGAAKSIKRDKPVCAIALYHREEDFFEIPNYLKSLCHEYKFYFRSEIEPVLFATVKNR